MKLDREPNAHVAAAVVEAVTAEEAAVMVVAAVVATATTAVIHAAAAITSNHIAWLGVARQLRKGTASHNLKSNQIQAT